MGWDGMGPLARDEVVGVCEGGDGGLGGECWSGCWEKEVEIGVGVLRKRAGRGVVGLEGAWVDEGGVLAWGA